MKLNCLCGYFTLALVGVCSAQNFIIRGLRPRQFRIVRRQYSVNDADQVNLDLPAAGASASSSASAGAASASSAAAAGAGGVGGLTGIRLGDLLGSLGGAGLLSQLGLAGFGSQPTIAIRQAPAIVRPRTIEIRRPLPALAPTPVHIQSAPVHIMPGPAMQTVGGAMGGTPILFDTQENQQDPNTPDTPDFLYAPRSMMSDMRNVEIMRNRAEADGVIFV